MNDNSARGAHASPHALSGWIGVLAAVSLVAGLLFAPTALGDHGGPKVLVDATNPASEDEDCNSHFKTLSAALTQCPLSENAIIVVDPGTYDEGQLTVDTKGVTIRSSDGARQTKINGCFTIDAKNVTLEALDIVATDCEIGVSVEDRASDLSRLIVHEAQSAGVQISGASESTQVTDSHLFDNGEYGLQVTGASLHLEMTDNIVDSNGAAGIILDGNSDRFTLSGNTVSLNGGAGLHIRQADEGQITGNTVKTNEGDGIRLERANNHSVVENTADSNAGFGISVMESGNNEVRSNALTSNEMGGLALRGGSTPATGNTVENNQISDSTASDAVGLLLKGRVTGNILLKNTIDANRIGVQYAGGEGDNTAPTRNILDSNDITASNDIGVHVAASNGLNEIRANTITGNMSAGIYVSSEGGNDKYVENTLRDNGAEGIRVEGSPDNLIQNNEIENNGDSDQQANENEGAGITLVNTEVTIVEGNTVGASAADGIRLVNTVNTRLLGNTVENRNGNGLYGAGVVHPLFAGNTIRGNSDRGVHLEPSEEAGCARLDFQRNTVTENSLGGIHVSNCEGVHLQMNQITDNMRFGLWVEGSEQIQARYNWWGDPSGPSGIFAGRGNAAIFQNNDIVGGNSTGLPSDQILGAVVPWLTDKVGTQTEDSVNGYVLRDFGPDSVDVTATDFAGVRMSLHDVESESKGVVILARYAQKLPTSDSIYAPVVLPNILRTVSVVTSGFGTDGQAVVEMLYDNADVPEGVDEESMQLFIWNGDQWRQMSGGSLPDVNVVQGTVELSRLQEGALIALAPESQQ
ncbi:MAG: right-handed parallel beta-helix repeat-containing protein [Salinibacter sp.]